MRRILVLFYALALAAPFTAGAGSGTRKHTDPPAAPQAGEVSSIEAYSRMLDRYFKSHPGATRYYVDALPEGKSDESSGTGKDWHEVRNQNAMLDAERGYATRSIAVLVKGGEIVYADIGEPFEHSKRDNGYYFRMDGTLAKISSDYYANMAEVHITQDYFYSAGGRRLRETTRCFEIITTSRRNIERKVSCGREEMKEEMGHYKVQVYAKNTELPGYSFLKRH